MHPVLCQALGGGMGVGVVVCTKVRETDLEPALRKIPGF